MGDGYHFTNSWFDEEPRKNWSHLLPQLEPKAVLEIGSYEGASACFLIETLGPKGGLDLTCVDSWAGGAEHGNDDMAAVEARFDANVALAQSNCSAPVSVTKHKGRSDEVLAYLLTQGRFNHFDFIYVDGSHQAPDVLSDAVLAFKLLKVQGVMVFDDYLWYEVFEQGKDINRSPKLAVDAFTNVYARKLDVLRAPLYQLFIRKTSD